MNLTTVSAGCEDSEALTREIQIHEVKSDNEERPGIDSRARDFD